MYVYTLSNETMQHKRKFRILKHIEEYGDTYAYLYTFQYSVRNDTISKTTTSQIALTSEIKLIKYNTNAYQ